MILDILVQRKGKLTSVSLPKVDLTDIQISTYQRYSFSEVALLASEWALRLGGDEGVDAALRRRGDDWEGWRRLADWGIGKGWHWGWDWVVGVGWEWDSGEALNELPWRLSTRVFIQPGPPGKLKIS